MIEADELKPKYGTPEWAEYWAGVIAEAQTETTVTIAGDDYPRIRYGDDYPDGRPQCRDCGVEHGQIHVWNCCVERCARCKDGQALICLCGEH